RVARKVEERDLLRAPKACLAQCPTDERRADAPPLPAVLDRNRNLRLGAQVPAQVDFGHAARLAADPCLDDRSGRGPGRVPGQRLVRHPDEEPVSPRLGRESCQVHQKLASRAVRERRRTFQFEDFVPRCPHRATCSVSATALLQRRNRMPPNGTNSHSGSQIISKRSHALREDRKTFLSGQGDRVRCCRRDLRHDVTSSNAFPPRHGAGHGATPASPGVTPDLAAVSAWFTRRRSGWSDAPRIWSDPCTTWLARPTISGSGGSTTERSLPG